MKLYSITLSIILICFSCVSPKQNIDIDAPTKTTDVSTLNILSNYNIEHKEYGTNTKVTVENEKRLMLTNALPNHKTGEFPNEGNPNKIKAQGISYTFPTSHYSWAIKKISKLIA